MWGVTGFDQIDFFEREKKVVGVFIAKGFDEFAIKWLVSAWRTIHDESDWRWHLLVPTIAPINDDEQLANSLNYDVRFARQLQTFYGVDDMDTPCIVFDNFDDTKQFFIRLPNDERELKRIFLDIAKFVKSGMPTDESDFVRSDKWRRRYMEELFNHIQIQRGMRQLVALTPKAVSIIFGKAAGVFAKAAG